MQGNFPPELAATPLEDIDSFYSNQRVIIADIFDVAKQAINMKTFSVLADLRSR
jgi:hypothetical protein